MCCQIKVVFSLYAFCRHLLSNVSNFVFCFYYCSSLYSCRLLSHHYSFLLFSVSFASICIVGACCYHYPCPVTLQLSSVVCIIIILVLSHCSYLLLFLISLSFSCHIAVIFCCFYYHYPFPVTLQLSSVVFIVILLILFVGSFCFDSPVTFLLSSVVIFLLLLFNSPVTSHLSSVFLVILFLILFVGSCCYLSNKPEVPKVCSQHTRAEPHCLSCPLSCVLSLVRKLPQV